MITQLTTEEQSFAWHLAYQPNCDARLFYWPWFKAPFFKIAWLTYKPVSTYSTFMYMDTTTWSWIA